MDVLVHEHGGDFGAYLLSKLCFANLGGFTVNAIDVAEKGLGLRNTNLARGPGRVETDERRNIAQAFFEISQCFRPPGIADSCLQHRAAE